MEPVLDSSSSGIVKFPTIHPKPAANEIYVRGSRPVGVYVKHARKVLEKHDTIVIHAMTAAIERAVRLSLEMRKEFPYLHCSVSTSTVPTIVKRFGTHEHELCNKSGIHIALKKAAS